MFSSSTTHTEHTRALKRVKVDSPVVSHTTVEELEAFGRADSPCHTQKRNSCEPLTPPSHDDDDHDHNVLTAEDVSPEGTVASHSSKSRSVEHGDDEVEVDTLLHEVATAATPTRASASPWRPAARLSTASAASMSSATAGVTTTSVPLPVSTNGAITTLRSLSQLALLVSSTNTTSAKEKTPPSLRLKAGESVMLLLYFDESSLRRLINAATSELSQMRVFTLNLAKLPPQDYEPTTVRRVGSGSILLHSPVHPGTEAAHSTHAVASTPSTLNAASADEEDEEEEEELVPAVHPMAAAAAAAATAASAERAPRSSAAPLTLEEAASVSSLSGDLHHASEIIGEKLRQMLSVDTILNPHASQQPQHSLTGSDANTSNASKREPLLFPAMIVWRAAGAPREEYPPAPPQTYSSQPSPTPAELFCDRMSSTGGPLVVKEATSIDQVHSLTLFRPVYTMENLFRTLAYTVAPSFAHKAPGDKSRSVLYLGASWCPPCMRFVHEMPQFISEDLPASVVCTVKADMDLAKPIYDYFKVEIIPTFIVLDNEVLMSCYERLQRSGVTATSGGCGAASQSEYLRSIQEAFSKAELARLQNSNRQLVSTFVSKHSQALSFDEDF